MTDRQLFRLGTRLIGLWLTATGIKSLSVGVIVVAMNLASPLSSSAMETFAKTINRAIWGQVFDGVMNLIVGIILIVAAERISGIIHQRDP